MRRFYLFLVYLIFFSVVNTQSQTHVVVDANTKRAIPFAAIKYSDEKQGFYTDEQGRFSLKNGAKNKIQISCLGYKPAYKSITQLKDSTFLEVEDIAIREIIVKSHKTKLKKIGYANKLKFMSWYLKPFDEFGIFMKPTKKFPSNIIRSILIPIEKTTFKKINGKWKLIKPKFKTAFRLNVYKFSEQNIQGKSLLSKSIMVYCNQNSDKIIHVDISDERIEFSEDGIFISIQMIGEIDENGNVIEKKKLMPLLRFTGKSERNITSEQYYKFTFNKKWEKMLKHRFHFDKDYKQAIGLVLETY